MLQRPEWMRPKVIDVKNLKNVAKSGSSFQMLMKLKLGQGGAYWVVEKLNFNNSVYFTFPSIPDKFETNFMNFP